MRTGCECDSSAAHQLPLCMIGDSITWAEDGDYWRKFLLEHIPSLAFVGNHTGVFGYSHEGEGGNKTRDVLKRIDDVPDCPYYSLLIGTNDNVESKVKSDIEKVASGTADRIIWIIEKLLKRQPTQLIFLGSLLACDYPDAPLRNDTNSATNKILLQRLDSVSKPQKIAWVDYANPVKKSQDWQTSDGLHPINDDYRLLAKVLADHIQKHIPTPIIYLPDLQNDHAFGVRIVNLWEEDESKFSTKREVIAGWYTLSYWVKNITGANPYLILRSSIQKENASFEQKINIQESEIGQRKALNFMTGYESMGYERSKFEIVTHNCEIEKVLFEKTRPSSCVSVYGKGSYFDTKSKISLGELIEKTL